MSLNVRRQRGRTFRALLPVFGGYLFFCSNEEQRSEVLRTNRIANIIEVKDQTKLIEQLLPIEQVLKSGVKISPHKYIEVGQRCRIKAGALADLEGIVVRTKGIMHLVLQVDMLGQAASVEVDSDMIDVIDD